MISDGDSKMVTKLQESKPYGENMTITKCEYVGHIQKRVGTGLRKAKQSVLACNRQYRKEVKKLKECIKKRKDKLGESAREKGRGKQKGKGKLVDDKELKKLQARLEEVQDKVVKDTSHDDSIDKIQQYYGNAIRNNPGNLEKMTKASPNEEPQHQYCPVGVESWCKYRLAQALGQNVPPHHTTIPEGYAAATKKVFERVCDKDLLKKCLKGATQNATESFNALIWARAPKIEFFSLALMQIAVSNSVLTFNSGSQGISDVFKRMEMEAGSFCTASLLARDECRVKLEKKRVAEASKKQRVTRRQKRKRIEEARIAAEGVTYEPGGF